ncbi:MAG TPA: endolytic transglycosylase MltG [Pyrinomonadaceae bacterium]|nr:endolytic transglycosylase MltG [Pyrinomonadaceae bacterium]
MNRLRLVLLLFVILLLVSAGVVVWTFREMRVPVAHARAEEYIEIPRGSSPDQITQILTSAGVIRRPLLFKIYLRVSGSASRLKAGEYRFVSPISPLSVLAKLEAGEQRLKRFTVVEGWTRWDIAERMAQVPEFKFQNTSEALSLLDDTSLIRDIDPEAQNLEGYLYPDTYNFPPDTTPREFVALMVKRFRQVWDGRMAERARMLNKSAREVLTVASLIETEAKLKEERPVISSVIYNRLRIGMALGVDSTVIYASKLAGKWRDDGKVYQSDLDRVSPYNTRRVRGLPPGPIASPGESSIDAALNPATTDYLYYVREPARDDGAHNFYSSEAEFARGVAALREWERARDARAAEAIPTPTSTPTPTPTPLQ